MKHRLPFLLAAKSFFCVMIVWSGYAPAALLPEVTRVYLAAPNIIGLTIEAQKVILAQPQRYVPQPGDERRIEKWPDGTVRWAKVFRQGQQIGLLQGKNLDYFTTSETVVGDPFLYSLAENAAHYRVTSSDDADFAAAQAPVAVFRKSLPMDWAIGIGVFPMRHRLYLKMSKDLVPGKKYSISIAALKVKNARLEFTYDSRQLQSEAVHTNQIGYRPDDPVKAAFLSLWMGNGGPLNYPPNLRFSIIEETSGKDVFAGEIKPVLSSDKTEESFSISKPRNTTLTSVYRMDFSAFKTPGRYRVHVAGIGCGFPFEIADHIWEKAFLVQMRGLYHNRSGIELGPPYTTFQKPRDFHPADGSIVTRSTYDVLTKGNEAWDDLAKGDTRQAVADAWGGYHDAGDWNPRRVSHMAVTMAQLELVELFPDYFHALRLNIPPMEGVPDILAEALFEIDCFRRLQLPDGGIPYGIETRGDPSPGEISWLSTMHAYVPAPNMRDSWYYAAVAARVSKLLKPFKPELAAGYLESAKKAFDWAEKDYAKRKVDGSLAAVHELWQATDARNFAALILYDLTAQRSYHDIFLQDSFLKEPSPEPYWWGKWIQIEAAFYYARLPDAKVDVPLKYKALAGVVKQAEKSLAYSAGNAFNLTHQDRHRPYFGGFTSTSGGSELVRAHYLTGKIEYLAGAVKSCQFQFGCNPNNIVYTTGLGANPIRHPLHLDSRSTGQPPPAGLTSFGNVDYWNHRGGFWDWPIPFISKPDGCYPEPYAWPLAEAYFDISMFVSMNEFVVDVWAPNVTVWGYLAARRTLPESAP